MQAFPLNEIAMLQLYNWLLMQKLVLLKCNKSVLVIENISIISSSLILN